ncbi:BgTH12-02256 [Blumeria graminis f. sp. triticale]|uniref:BgTH12-02256 n=1 Tax=Blumeria graminis f. sp. triticale TaxID=1689686 RepID=A0A9W4GET2_BLUGR|nr:BgTH12-02256 [Blumeria graminis f. sp. triticale]
MERWREFYVPPKSNTPWALGRENLKKFVSPMSKLDRHFKTAEYGRSCHGSRGNYPPSPSVEDENVSLAREHLSVLRCSDPPHRGSIDQNPIIIEVNVIKKKSCNFSETINSKEKSKRMKNTDKNTRNSKSQDKDAGIPKENSRSTSGQTSARHKKSDHKKLPALSVSGSVEGNFLSQRGDLSPVTDPQVKEPNISSQRGHSSPVAQSKPQDSTHSPWQREPPLVTKTKAADSTLPSQQRELSPVTNSRVPNYTLPSRQKDPSHVGHSRTQDSEFLPRRREPSPVAYSNIQDSTHSNRPRDSSPVTNSRAPDYTRPSRQKDPSPVAHSRTRDSAFPSQRREISPVSHSRIQESAIPSRRVDSSPVTNPRVPDYNLPSRQKDPSPVGHSRTQDSEFLPRRREPSPVAYSNIQDSTHSNRPRDSSPVTNSRAPDYTLPSRQKDPSPVAHSRTRDSAFPSQRREISPVSHSRIQESAIPSRRVDSSPVTNPRVQDSNFPSRLKESLPVAHSRRQDSTLPSRRKESSPVTNSRVQGSTFSSWQRESSPMTSNKDPDYILPSRRREPSPVINPNTPESTIPPRKREASPVSHSRTHDSIPPPRRREASPVSHSRTHDSIPPPRRRESSPVAHPRAHDSHFLYRRKDSSPVNNSKASDSIFPSRRQEPSPVAYSKSQDTHVQSRRREASPISHSRIQDSNPLFRQGDSQAAIKPKAQESTHLNRRREPSPMAHRLQDPALKVVNSCKNDQKHWNNPSNQSRSGKNTPPELTPEISEKNHSRRRTGTLVPEKPSRGNSPSPPGNRCAKVQIIETCQTRGRRVQNEHIRQRQPSESSITSRAERCTSTHSVRFAHDVDTDQQHRRRYDVSSDEDNSNFVEIIKNSRYRPQNRIREESRHRSSSKSIKTLRDTKSVSRLNSPLSSPSAPSSPAFMKERTCQLPAWKLKQKFQNDPSRSPSPFSPERQLYRTDKRSPVTTLKMRRLRSPVSDRFENQTEASKRGIASFEKVLTQPLSPYLPPLSLQPLAASYPFDDYFQSSDNFDHKYTIPVPLPPCPRMEFVEGRNDWLTLPHCPNFDVCPSCFDMSIAPTEFNQFFVPSPRNEPGVRVLCDFGKSPWFRIAWLMIITENLGSLDLFHELANIAETLPECLGEHETVRQWCSIVNTRTGVPIRGFKVCLTCVKNVEILLPILHGMFVYLDSYNAETGICALRSNSRRFVQYFDELEKIAVEANTEGAPPDPHSLERLALHFDTFEECQLDTELFDCHWHIIPQLPEFTVCGECFNAVVWPLLEEGRDIPKMFSEDVHLVSRASCQLYSPYMRDAFLLAVTHNDYWMLASIARQRREAELAFKADNMGVRRMKHIGWEAENEAGPMEVWKSWE